MIETDRIYHMDCLEGMSLMADGSVDAIITDLPYGVLNRKNKAAEWDRRIPFAPCGSNTGESRSRTAPSSCSHKGCSPQN